MPPADPPPRAEDPPPNRKHQVILDAATTLFLRHGYLGTSMDEVAAAAGVSKQTVYSHFGDKQGLFTEIVMATVNEVSDPVHDELLRLQDSGDIEGDLRDLARRQLTQVMQPRVLQLRRLVIGEANRFPALGKTFYDLGPGRTIATLAELFEQLSSRGTLKLTDPALAAEHFNWLVMAMPLNRAMLLGDDDLSAGDIEHYADSGVRAFLGCYR